MATKMVDELPKNSKNGPSRKRGTGNFTLKLKPTEGNNGYRFRLLSFTTGTNTRDYPFIEKFVHEKWEKDAEGKGVFKGFVTCPVTKYVRPTLPPKSNPFDLCPICKYVNSNFLAYKESEYKDKIAGKVIREHKRKYVALVPVYVVKDPHEPTNTNKPKVWVIKDKEVYDKLNSLIKKQQQKTKVFNSGEAVDILIFVKKEEVIINEGKPNEFKYFETKIDKFGFGKNVYKIDAINDTFIEGFPFDDEFYSFSSPEELEKYYNDYVISSSNIPEDGIATEEIAQTTALVETTETTEVVDDTITEADEKIVTQEEIVDKDLSDIDDLINDAVPEETVTEKPVVTAPAAKPAVTVPVVKPTAKPTVITPSVKPAVVTPPVVKPVVKPTVTTPVAKPVVTAPAAKSKLKEPVATQATDIDDIDGLINDVLGE
jgi:hypothetical protein